MNNSLVTKLHLIAWLFCLVSFAYNILCAHIDDERGHPVKNASSHQYLVANYSTKEVPVKPRFQCDFTGQCFTVWVLEPACSNGYLEPKDFRPGYLKVSLRGSNLCTNSSSTFSLSWLWGSIKTGGGREIRRCREMWTCMIPLRAILPSKLEPRWLDVVVSTNKNVTEYPTQMDLPITISVRSKLLGNNENTQNSESKPVKGVDTDLDFSKNKDDAYYSEKPDENQLHKESDTLESIKLLPFLLQTNYANAHDKIGSYFTSKQVSTSKEVMKLLLRPSFYRSPPSNTNINLNESLNKHNLRKLTQKSQIQNNSLIDIIRHNYEGLKNKENYPHMKVNIKSLPRVQKSSDSYLKFDSHDIKVNSSKKSDNSPSGSTQAVFLPLQRRLNNRKGVEFSELKRRLNNSKFLQIELRARRSISHVDEDEAADIAVLMGAESKEDRNKIASMIASDFESTAGLSNPIISRNQWHGGHSSSIGRAENHGLRDMNRLINVIEDEEDKVASNLPLGDGDQEDLLVQYNRANSNLVPPESKHKKVVVFKPKEETRQAKHKPKPKPKAKPEPPKPTKKPLVIRKLARTRHQNRGRGRGKREAVQSHITIHSDPVLLAREVTHRSRRRWRGKRGTLAIHHATANTTGHSGPPVVPKKNIDPQAEALAEGAGMAAAAVGDGDDNEDLFSDDETSVVSDSEAEASAEGAGMAAAAVGDGDDSKDLLSDDEASVVSDAEPAVVAAAAAGAASVAESDVHEAVAHETAAAAEEEEDEEEQLTAETVIFIVLLCLLVAILIIALCVWFASRYQEAKKKHELSEALPFYNTNDDLDDVGNDGGMFDSKSRGSLKLVARHTNLNDDPQQRKANDKKIKNRLKERRLRAYRKVKLFGIKVTKEK